MKGMIAFGLVIVLLISGGSVSIGEEEQEMGILDRIEEFLENAAYHSFLKHHGLLTEDKEALEYAEAFLNAAENEDIDAMRNLFAANAIEEIGEDQINEMLNAFVTYFEGGNIEFGELGGPYSAGHLSNGKYSKEVRDSFDITTDANEYRMVVKCIARDDWEADNIGIWSISIIVRSKDVNPEYTYWGDAKYQTGIFFDVPRPER